MGQGWARPDWQDRTWPFILHGDGGTYARKTQSSIMIVSVKSLLAPTFEGNILPGFILPKDIATETTADELWKVYVHGLNAAFDGVHSTVDSHGNFWPDGSPQALLAGEQLCGGNVHVVIWNLVGDLDFLGNDVRFPQYNTNRPCWLCPVSRIPGSRALITDMSTHAVENHALPGLESCDPWSPHRPNQGFQPFPLPWRHDAFWLLGS